MKKYLVAAVLIVSFDGSAFAEEFMLLSIPRVTNAR